MTINTWQRTTDQRTETATAGSTRNERYEVHDDWILISTDDEPATPETEPGEASISGGEGGWYEVTGPDGVERIRGREAAEARLDELLQGGS